MKKDPLYFFLWVSAQAQETILMINRRSTGNSGLTHFAKDSE